MSCDNCTGSLSGQQQAFHQKLVEAVKWSNENKLSVAIYVEGYEYYFMKAELAISQGKFIKEIVTYKAE